MIKDNILKEYLSTYYGQAEDISTWFNAGKMNLQLAEFLLKKYNSAHKRNNIKANELVQLSIEPKKSRIDPYHLILHKYIMMFFGLSLECYLKGLLIRKGKIIPLNKDGKGLSKKILKHLDDSMFENALRSCNTNEKEVIERLRRAIDNGKYPLETKLTHLNAYTEHLESDIKATRKMILMAKNEWENKLRFQ